MLFIPPRQRGPLQISDKYRQKDSMACFFLCLNEVMQALGAIWADSTTSIGLALLVFACVRQVVRVLAWARV